MDLESHETPHILVFMDEAGFNLSKCRRRGQNITGQRATVEVLWQHGGTITTSTATSENGVSTHIPVIGPSNTQHLLAFLDALFRDLIPDNESSLAQTDLPNYLLVWDNVSLHWSNTIREWFHAHHRMQMEYLPPDFPFLNHVEEFFSAWRWKVYDHQPYSHVTLLTEMSAACDDAPAGSWRWWLRHARRYFT